MRHPITLTLLFIPFFIDAQVVIHLDTIPESTPDSATIYLAGDINAWTPNNEDYKFKLSKGDYWLTVIGSGDMQFKITRGSWQTVEGDKYGAQRPNRSFSFDSLDTLHLSIASWEDQVSPEALSSTANAQVSVWKEAMQIPQLKRTRRICVYLPSDYKNSNKSYPVLYMHDGQNLFDAATGFNGEWEIDETLTSIENDGIQTAIIVAIDNGGQDRINEYSTFKHDTYGGGEGTSYIDFIVQTLKPEVDKTFRTLTGPENTGIMGSSMGGLVSHSAFLKYPDTFGRIGIFSPSYWFSEEYFKQMDEHYHITDTKIYLLVGERESDGYMAKMARKMYEKFSQSGYSAEQIRFKVNPEGEHAESFWAGEFEEAFKWLFTETN